MALIEGMRDSEAHIWNATSNICDLGADSDGEVDNLSLSEPESITDKTTGYRKRKKAGSGGLHACNFDGCSAIFNRPWRLERHRALHTGERAYVCPVEGCVKRYTNQSHLKRHKSVHSPVSFTSNIKCMFVGCSRVFKTNQALRKHHQRQHKPGPAFACAHCDQRFARHNHLRAHLYVHTGILQFKCAKCDAAFETQTEAKRHDRSHKSYSCSVVGCSVTSCFTSWNLLRKHIALSHQPAHKCECCYKTFTSECRLQTHVKSHFDSDPEFTCPIAGCFKQFLYKRNLTQHIRRSHEEGTSFICPIEECGQKLTWKTSFDKHMRRHDTMSTQMKSRGKPTKKRKDAGQHKKCLASVLSDVQITPELEIALINKDKVDTDDELMDEAKNMDKSDDDDVPVGDSNVRKETEIEVHVNYNDY